MGDTKTYRSGKRRLVRGYLLFLNPSGDTEEERENQIEELIKKE